MLLCFGLETGWLECECRPIRILQIQSEATDEELEDALSFQLEELAIMADEELALIPMMAGWAPWEVRPLLLMSTFYITPPASSIEEICHRVGSCSRLEHICLSMRFADVTVCPFGGRAYRWM